MAKKTNAVLMTVVVIAIIGALYYIGNQQGLFSITGTGDLCADYTTMPNSPICNTEIDCISQLAPDGIGDNVLMRCQNNQCQVAIIRCAVES